MAYPYNKIYFSIEFPMNLSEFLEQFIIKDGFYIPKDPSQNHLRHFGERTQEGLLLRHEEVLYLYDREFVPVDTRTRAYFGLKNSEYNVLFRKDREARIFNKKKHFNREKEREIGVLGHCERNESFEEKMKEIRERNELADEAVIFAVEGWGDYCLIEVKPVEVPSREICENLLKRS